MVFSVTLREEKNDLQNNDVYRQSAMQPHYLHVSIFPRAWIGQNEYESKESEIYPGLNFAISLVRLI